jgi:Resolvase, N terminal domain
MRIGYARVSTAEQSLDLQLDALRHAGGERVFTEHASAAHTPRLGLSEARSHLRPGDVLVVWKLDRLGRSVKGLVDFVGAGTGGGRRAVSGSDRWHRHHHAPRALFLSPDGCVSPNGTGTHHRADESWSGSRPQAGASGGPEAPHDTKQDCVSAATPAGWNATPRGGAQSRSLYPHSLSLGAGVKSLRSPTLPGYGAGAAEAGTGTSQVSVPLLHKPRSAVTQTVPFSGLCVRCSASPLHLATPPA